MDIAHEKPRTLPFRPSRAVAKSALVDVNAYADGGGVPVRMAEMILSGPVFVK
jgi:hypothetical protein